MKYTTLGNSGLVVSQFSLGAWHLPGSGQKDALGIETVDADALKRVMRKAFDLGINFIDGANRYHGRMSTADLEHVGNSEKLLGGILGDYEREAWVVATKVRGPMGGWPNGEGLSRKHIMWQAFESLRRLKLDYIDLYQIHWSDSRTPKIETLRTLNNLIDRGLVRYIGVSNHSAAELVEFTELARRYGMEGFVSVQEPYNMLERSVEQEIIPIARKYEMAVMAYVPLAQGVLAGKYLGGVSKGSRASYIEEVRRQYLNEETQSAVRSIMDLAKEKGVTPTQLALAWMLHKQSELGVTIIPILGITKVEHLEDNVGALDVKLDTGDVAWLEETAGRAKLGPRSY